MRWFRAPMAPVLFLLAPAALAAQGATVRGRVVHEKPAEPVEIFAVVRVDDNLDHLAIDPVCQMAVDPQRAIGRLQRDEKAYYFCSLTCAAAFAQHPERYAE